MATLNSSDRLTAIEAVKRDGVNEDQRRIIEELTVTNELLLDAPIVEANDRTVNKNVVRTALPHGQHRIYNQGVGSAASQTKTIHDTVSQLAIYSKVDASLVKNASNPQEFLMDECAAFLHGMGEDMAEDIVYGDHSKNPAYIDGFATRRNKIDNKTVFDFGGTGNNLTSIYLVKWGKQFVKYIYPREAMGLGVQRIDKGIQTVKSETGDGEYEAYVNYFQADYGISVGNEKSLIRLANVPLNATGENIIKKILSLRAKLVQGDGTISVLCNNDIMSLMDIATLDKNNVVYTAEDPWGRELTKIRDMRLRQVDAILSTESAIS